MRQNFIKAVILVLTFFMILVATHAQVFNEDFDGGLPNDWMAVQMDGSVVNATSNWQYTTTGPDGPVASEIGSLNSTTASNGWMIFDSDANCSETDQDVWLISPSIDCSNLAEVFVIFETRFASFFEQVSIQVSTDDMATWTEFLLFTDVGPTAFAGQPDGSLNPYTAILDISSAASNQEDVKIAFRFLSDETTLADGPFYGCAYAWQIDDVIVTDVNPTLMFDMIANPSFFAIPQNLSTPASQLESIGFLCDIKNIGQQDMTGVNLNITITENGGGIVHDRDLAYGTIASDSLAENGIFPMRFTPPNTPNVIYDGAYTITADSTDEDFSNNSISFQFEVSDSVFRKENGTGDGIAPIDNNSGNWTVASYYYVPNGDGMVCSSIAFKISNAPAVSGTNVNVYLYEWEDVDEDGVVDINEKNGDVAGKILANSGYEIKASDEIITLVLEPWIGNDPIRLKDDTQYILSVEMEKSSNDELVFLNGNELLNYNAMEFLNNFLNMTRYTAFWNEDGLGFNSPLVPMVGFSPYIRMHVNEEIVNTKTQLAPENIVEVFPNPASDFVSLKMEFVTAFDNVNVKITDASGKTLLNQVYDNVTQQLENFDVSKFAVGTYFVHVQTEEGNRVERFVVMK